MCYIFFLFLKEGRRGWDEHTEKVMIDAILKK